MKMHTIIHVVVDYGRSCKMTDIHKIIQENHGDEPWEPDNVKDDYKEFKDYTYDIKMSIKDINYLLDILNV